MRVSGLGTFLTIPKKELPSPSPLQRARLKPQSKVPNVHRIPLWENHSKIELDIADDDSYTVHATKDSASILVQDDDFVASVAVLTISPNPVEETEGKTLATITVTTEEDKKPHGQVSIPLSTSDSTAEARMRTIPQWSGSLVFKEEDFRRGGGRRRHSLPGFQDIRNTDTG